MTAAADKLNRGIGEDKSVFRDSLTANIVEVAERMQTVNLSQDPTISAAIKKVLDLGTLCDNRKDELRNNEKVREKAAQKVQDVATALAAKMEGLV